MLKKIFILLLLLIFSAPVLASNWQEIMYKNYIDLDSWEYKNGYSYVWIKSLNQGEIKPINNQKIWYDLDYIKIDCSNKFYEIQQILFYNLKNEIVETFNFSNNPKKNLIPPESRAEKLYNYVCK